MKDEYLCIFKTGKLYVKGFYIDGYDSEIIVNFTSVINEAKRFDINDIELYKDMLELLMGSAFETITEVKESKGE
jgi:hypothetical protein